MKKATIPALILLGLWLYTSYSSDNSQTIESEMDTTQGNVVFKFSNEVPPIAQAPAVDTSAFAVKTELTSELDSIRASVSTLDNKVNILSSYVDDSVAGLEARMDERVTGLEKRTEIVEKAITIQDTEVDRRLLPLMQRMSQLEQAKQAVEIDTTQIPKPVTGTKSTTTQTCYTLPNGQRVCQPANGTVAKYRWQLGKGYVRVQ